MTTCDSLQHSTNLKPIRVCEAGSILCQSQNIASRHKHSFREHIAQSQQNQMFYNNRILCVRSHGQKCVGIKRNVFLNKLINLHGAGAGSVAYGKLENKWKAFLFFFCYQLDYGVSATIYVYT